MIQRSHDVAPATVIRLGWACGPGWNEAVFFLCLDMESKQVPLYRLSYAPMQFRVNVWRTAEPREPEEFR